ncbi:hypothetical protein, partial [Delftia acidovorans]
MTWRDIARITTKPVRAIERDTGICHNDPMLAAQGHQLCRLGLGSGHDTQSTKRRKDSTTPSP